MDRGTWQATVHRVTRVEHDLVIKPPVGLWDLRSLTRDQTHGPAGEAQGPNHRISREVLRVSHFAKDCFVFLSLVCSRIRVCTWEGALCPARAGAGLVCVTLT